MATHDIQRVLRARYGGVEASDVLVQFARIELERPDALVWMQNGKFFEVYGDVASLLGRLLDLRVAEKPLMTGRDGQPVMLAMTGITIGSEREHLGRLIARFRQAWQDAGHDWEPRIAVSRSIFPLVTDLDRQLFWRDTHSTDQVGHLEGGLARFGKTYAGEPDKLVAQLRADEAIAAADTLLLTVPNMLGVDYNAYVIDSVLTHLAPALGWR